MGSAIGDYVHYRVTNYRKYGTNFPGKGTYQAYSAGKQKNAVMLRMQAMATSVATSAEIQQLRANLASIFSAPSENDSAELKAMRAWLENLIVSQWSMATINWETGDVTVADVLRAEQVALKAINYKRNRMRVNVSTVNGRLKAIESVIGQIKSETTTEEAKKQVKNIETQYNLLVEEVKKMIAEITETKKGMPSLKSLRFDTSKGEVTALLDKMNSLISTIKGVFVPNIAKGEILEAALVAAQFAGTSAGEEELEKAFRSSLDGKVYREGNTTCKVIIGKENFFEGADLSGLNNAFPIDDNGSYVELGLKGGAGSQNKVDVNYYLSDGRKSTISAKNYNFGKSHDIHLVSNSPFLYLIQDEDANFVNHYLNTNVRYESDGKMANSENTITSYHNAMKYTLLYKAISGDTYGRNSIAQLFIVNNNKAKGIESIHIYTIADILKKAYLNINAYATVTADGADISAKRFNNVWAESSWEARINSLLAQLRNTKISAGLKKSALSQISSSVI